MWKVRSIKLRGNTLNFVSQTLTDFGGGFLFGGKFGTGVPVIILSGKGCMTLIMARETQTNFPDADRLEVDKFFLW